MMISANELIQFKIFYKQRLCHLKWKTSELVSKVLLLLGQDACTQMKNAKNKKIDKVLKKICTKTATTC